MSRYAPFVPRPPQEPPQEPRGVEARVRVAQPVDVTGIVAVAATRGVQPVDLPERVARWVADDDRHVLVAVAAVPEDPDDVARHSRDGVVAWAMVGRWTPDDAPHGHVVSALTVHPQWWRRGLGTQLLSGLQQWTWERADVLWSIVNARNEVSLALHCRLGFVEAGRGPGFGGVAFDGGEGLLLRSAEPSGPRIRRIGVWE